MSLAAPEQLVRPSIRRASREQLDLLVESLADSSQPVWVQDAVGSCIYRNHQAANRAPQADALAFDLVDHTGSLVGRIITLAA